MIRIKCGDIYYNTQVYFAKNYIDNLPNDDKAWARAYHDWLKDQGATVLHSNKDLFRTALDVTPNFDYFVFENDSHVTMFMLRWS